MGDGLQGMSRPIQELSNSDVEMTRGTNVQRVIRVVGAVYRGNKSLMHTCMPDACWCCSCCAAACAAMACCMPKALPGTPWPCHITSRLPACVRAM